MNGLSQPEFEDIRTGLIKDAERILAIANSTTGHLGDIVSGIGTVSSIMDIKAKKLWQMFEGQKQFKA